MIEILAPAGNEECAYASLNAGANAIYLGLGNFSARASAENFDVEALRRVCAYAHLLNAKVYVCLNTLVKDSETDSFFEAARLSYNAGADALLIQDMFLGKRLKQTYPALTLHLSTQGGCCNEYGALLAKEYGFSRVVLARETPLSEMKKISRIIETEAFVQGALCSSFSGQCFFSSFAGNNSGNRGKCKQPCRKKYTLNRAGYESPAYCLSLSDLSVGERVKEYLEAGVSSLKIEGRMRRSEYAAAAVKYYVALLNGGDAQEKLCHLKRAYNRGNYTEGLAFGQNKTLLSRRVQGHIGEEIGTLQITPRGYFCKSAFLPEKGDGFKILRGGEEAGGALFREAGAGGFFVSSSDKLQTGDVVCVTTSKHSRECSLQKTAARSVKVCLRFVAGERPLAQAEGLVFEGEELLSPAKNAPLSEEEIISCFQKVDALPLSPEISVTTQNAFLQKSALNAFRREFYARLIKKLSPSRTPLEQKQPPHVCIAPVKERKNAVMGGGNAPIVIYKPTDYSCVEPKQKEGSYLYLPPLLTSADEELIAPALSRFEGVYCDAYYAIALAKKYNLKLFAGTGFPLTNRYAVEEVRSCAEYFALSKEISGAEQRSLSAAGAFHLAAGAIKLMDLCYCPFERTCRSCDKKSVYLLTDEAGRSFPLRRYELADGHCRFEVYNCVPLAADNGFTSTLTDNSVQYASGVSKTKGHLEGSML